MKFFVFTLVILLFSGNQSVCGQDIHQSNIALRASNQVSEMNIYNLTLDEKDSTLSHILLFNENGKTIRENRFDQSGELLVRYVYHFDSTGFMEKYQAFDGKNELRGENIFRKTENESLDKQSKGNSLPILREFDSTRNTMTLYQVEKGTKTVKAIFKYDNYNRIAEHKAYVTGKYYIPNSSRYDEKGHDQKTTIIRKYVRDSEGNIIEERIIRNEILTEIIHFKNIKRHP